jgi:mono/diheme cytochrome c family protein
MSGSRAVLLAAALAGAAPLSAIAADDAAATALGDPRRGEALFTGATPFTNLGAPCLGCHGVAGHGLARAASFGPDLSAVYESYGPEALDGALADMPFPSMAPLYAKHVVTAQERADLAAFLRGASAGKPPPRLGASFVAGVGGFAALFLFLFIGVGRARRGARPGTAQRETP